MASPDLLRAMVKTSRRNTDFDSASGLLIRWLAFKRVILSFAPQRTLDSGVYCRRLAVDAFGVNLEQDVH